MMVAARRLTSFEPIEQPALLFQGGFDGAPVRQDPEQDLNFIAFKYPPSDFQGLLDQGLPMLDLVPST